MSYQAVFVVDGLAFLGDRLSLSFCKSCIEGDIMVLLLLHHHVPLHAVDRTNVFHM